MNRRIRKKKLTFKLYHINQALIRNAYLMNKFSKGKTINGVIARCALPISNFELKVNKRMLEAKLKRGDY